MLTAAQFEANVSSTTVRTLPTKRGLYVVTTTQHGSRKEKASDLDRQRVRFNWGFWDGRSDVKNGRDVRDVTRHFDQAYAAGYAAGTAASPDVRSSEPAWVASSRTDDYEGWRT